MTTTAVAASRVLLDPPAAPAAARAHFAAMLACHCDPSDLAHDLAAGARGIVVLDCRSAEAHAAARLPGAIALPWATIDAAAVAALPPAHVYVTYCWGQACNAGARGAARLAALGLPVKELLGGIAAWEAEGAPLERG